MMSFERVAKTFREAYPTATEVSIIIRPDNIHVSIVFDDPSEQQNVMTLDGTLRCFLAESMPSSSRDSEAV